jgi:hypothetical protein
MESLQGPSGEQTAGFYAYFYSGDVWITVHADSLGRVEARYDDQATVEFDGDGGFRLFDGIEDGSVLRQAWAAWNADFTCAAVKGRVGSEGGFVGPFEDLPVVDQPLDKALYAFPSDFAGGHSASTNLVQAGVSEEFVRDTRGFLFGLMLQHSGRMRAEGPAGETLEDSQQIFVRQETFGRWRYTLDASLSPWGAPVLWILELSE